MPQKLLYLLDRHALVDSGGGKRSAKLVGVYALSTRLFTQLAQSRFNSTYCNTVGMFIERHEKSICAIGTIIEVSNSLDNG